MSEDTRPSDSEATEEAIVEALEASEGASGAPPPPPIDEDEESVGGKRLPSDQWAEIETHWECGTMTAVEILKKYPISETALRTHLKRHKTIRNSKRHLIKKDAEVKIMGAVAAAADPMAVAFDQKRKGRITQTRETFMNQSAAVTAGWNKQQKLILEEKATHADSANAFKAMRHEILAAERIMVARLRCLNADADIDEAKLPTLIFRDLSEEEIADMQNADKDEGDLDFPEVAIGGMDDDEVIEEGVPSPVSS